MCLTEVAGQTKEKKSRLDEPLEGSTRLDGVQGRLLHRLKAIANEEQEEEEEEKGGRKKHQTQI